MPRQENAAGISAIAGAASVVRLTWPLSLDAFVTGIDATWAGAKFNPQGKGGLTNFLTTGGVGTGGSVTGSTKKNGRFCVALNSPAGAGNGFQVTISPQLLIAQERPAANIIDETACWSFRILAAFDNPAGAQPLDCGIDITSGSVNAAAGKFMTSQQPGYALYVTGPQQVSFMARLVNLGALTVNDVIALPVGFDIRQFHNYELQWITGNPSTDPYVQVFIDGIASSAKYSLTAAAALLPNESAGGGTNALRVGLCNVSNAVVPKLYLAQTVLTIARTQQDLF